MANGKMRGRPRKTTNQGVENSKIQQIPRTFLKRKIDSDEHDKNDPSTPLPPKRQSLCNNASNCNSDVCKSEVCIKSSGNVSSPRKGEFKRRLFGVENRNSWRTRYLRSMGKVTNCLELPNAMRGNVMTRKNSHANSSGSKKYDKQSLADSPPDTCNEMHIEQSKMDMSNAELADNEEISGPIVETEATLYTPDSTDKHSSSDCADLFALQQVFTPSTTEQNGVSICRISPENVDHDILTPEVFGNGSAYAENPSLSPSAAQIALSCKSDMTVLAAGSIAGRLPETQYKVENCESMNVGSPNVFQDHSGDSPEQLTSQGPDRKEPEREAIMLREHGDIGECEESDCKRIRLSHAFQPSGMHSSAGKGQAFILKSLTTVEICQDEKEVNQGSGATSEMAVLEPKEQCERSEDCKSYINQVSPVLHVSQPKVRSGPPSDGTLSPTTRQLRSHISKVGASPANLATNLESMQKDVSVSKNQPLWNSTKIKLKLKMPEKIMVDKVPSSVKALLLTGLLEGCSVRYLGRAEKVMLTGVIRGAGVLCSCNLCKGKQVVSICNFEEHAGSTARHASDFIVLDNGRSLRDVLEEGKGVEPGNFPDVIRKATDSSNRGFRACRKCRVPLDQSNQGKSNLLCPTCDPNQQSQPKVETTPIVRRRGRPRLSDQKVEQKLQTKLLTKTSPNLKVRERPSVQLQTKAPQKDMMLHKIIFKPHGLPDGTKLAYYVKGQRLLDGHKQGFGIFCSCCKTVLSCSQFEAHAGRASRRNPYNSIYLADGQSLHELAVSLTRQNANIDENEDYCTECGDGGDLVCCDGCPRAFHKECVGLSCVPKGKYYCSYCPQQCGRGRKLNGKEPKTAGKSVRVGTLEKPSNRCTRVVKAPEKTVGGCVLCRREDFEKNGFGDRTVMLCDQCEKEFHVGCLREHSMADLKELPQDEWFCSNDCKTIHSALQKLVEHGPKPIPKELMKKPIDKDVEEQSSTQINWQLLYGKRRDPDKRELLSEAAAIFAECFDPIIDPVTGRDLIPSMVYSRSVRDQEFGGMYCAVLTVDSVVVSAGVFRIFGRQVAELPLVATSPKSQGQGYFQALFSGIERLLGFLNVENLVLPAAEEAESLWINKFGFTNMSDEQLYMYRKDLQIMSFQGNAMLEKPLSSLSSVHAGPNKGP